jgi:hypothetical protein
MYGFPPLPIIYIEEGERPFIIHHSYHSYVGGVNKRSNMVFLSLVFLLVYLISH